MVVWTWIWTLAFVGPNEMGFRNGFPCRFWWMFCRGSWGAPVQQATKNVIFVPASQAWVPSEMGPAVGFGGLALDLDPGYFVGGSWETRPANHE